MEPRWWLNLKPDTQIRPERPLDPSLRSHGQPEQAGFRPRLPLGMPSLTPTKRLKLTFR